VHRITEIKENFDSDLKKINNEDELEELRVKYLGRKGLVTTAFTFIKDVTPDEKPLFGAELNKCKKAIESEFKVVKEKFNKNDSDEKIDLTLPGRKSSFGRKHPLLQVADEIKHIFTSFGFAIEDGPEIETDYYNFEALNIPKTHPARAMQDTLYITEDIVLRTHTSPVQIRVMEERKPPIRIIAPGRVYRRDTPDATHSPFFHQVEEEMD